MQQGEGRLVPHDYSNSRMVLCRLWKESSMSYP